MDMITTKKKDDEAVDGESRRLLDAAVYSSFKMSALLLGVLIGFSNSTFFARWNLHSEQEELSKSAAG
jgi:hypothetical protein